MTEISRSIWNSALELQGFLQLQHFEFCFIGGIVVQRWGEPRTTDDIELTVLANLKEEPEIVDQLLQMRK